MAYACTTSDQNTLDGAMSYSAEMVAKWSTIARNELQQETDADAD
ncbi:hypothetical protein OHA25_59975 (plasmid) [Nonomuraea sp. NBC_00507]